MNRSRPTAPELPVILVQRPSQIVRTHPGVYRSPNTVMYGLFLIKQHTAIHLVRLLQSRRLAERGIRLTRIATILREDADSSAVLEEIDTELKASMRRLRRARRSSLRYACCREAMSD